MLKILLQYFFRFDTIVLGFLILFSFSANAALSDTSNTRLKPYMDIVNSDLTNTNAVDSMRVTLSWEYWQSLTNEEFKYAVVKIEERLLNSPSLEEKYVAEEYLKDMYNVRGNLGKVVIHYEKLIATASALQDTAKIIHNYYHLSWHLSYNGLIEHAVGTYSTIIDLVSASPDTSKYLYLYMNYGYFCSEAGWRSGNKAYLDSAVKYLGICYDYSSRHPETQDREAEILYAMALARAGDKRKAIVIGHDGLAKSYMTNNALYIARFNKQISQYYLSLEMQDSAYFYLLESAQYDELAFPDDPMLVSIENGAGKLHLYNVLFLIMYYEQYAEYDKCVELLDRIIYGSEKAEGDGVMLDYYQLGGKYYYLDGQYEKSAHCYEMYSTMMDSIHKVEISNSAEVNRVQLKTQIELEQQRANFEKHQLDILAKTEQEHLRTIIMFGIIGSVLLVMFLVFMYRRFRVTRKQKKLIEEQKVLVEDAYGELDKKNKSIMDSISYAKRIQSAILPADAFVKEQLPDSFIWYKPKQIVAGDFYWVKQSGEKIIFAAADCTGHGVPGAMVSVVCNNGLNRAVREYGLTDPGDILNTTRELVVTEFEKGEGELQDGMDIALVALGPSYSDNPNADPGITLSYAGANRPLWLVRKGHVKVEDLTAGLSDEQAQCYKVFEANGYSLIEIRADKQPIGKFRNSAPYNSHEIEIEKGDTIYVFSDGYVDQFNWKTKKRLKSAKFRKELLEIQDLSMDEQKSRIQSLFYDWQRDYTQIDDVCVIGVRL